jgi:serine/threonine protein kinase
MVATDWVAGRMLGDGRYRLDDAIAAGGMASVWRARDTRLNRPVAVKLLAEQLTYERAYVQRFRREARVAAALSHANLVAVYDYGDEGGRPYLVMELVSGRSLQQRLRGGDLRDVRPLKLARELLGALAHMHAAGILHRDVKPANVLLDDAGTARLTDFGIARPADATQLTQTGVVLGTPRYLAPEVARGEPATPRSDLFSVGRVLEELAGALRPADPSLRALARVLADPDATRRPASAPAALDALAVFESSTGAAPTAAQDRTQPTVARRPPVKARRAAPRGVTALRLRVLAVAVAVALAVAVAVALAVTVAITAGGRGRRAGPNPPSPSAPLARQLDALSQAIDAYRR